ncbi:hypothetical protein MKUB_02990 [Mycobacterium kubicae]|uniref:Uncharacterized protein n=1 Tax=Mycobacterium kubicae TaxID=120959 RepID=A0ABQ1BHU5_9MYCO|nr:hypothetical protein [Mycobacterium kubicae]GFG62809.1 hypothetical protein MKUB_02990 [Mycobacterium kubicae]
MGGIGVPPSRGLAAARWLLAVWAPTAGLGRRLGVVGGAPAAKDESEPGRLPTPRRGVCGLLHPPGSAV